MGCDQPFHCFHLTAAADQTDSCTSPQNPKGNLPWVTPGLLRVTGTNHIKREKQQSHLTEWQSTMRGVEGPPAVPGASEAGVGRRLRVTDHVSSNRWRSLHAEKEPNWAPGALCNLKPRSRGPPSQARWQLAGPARMGTQGWMASRLTTCLNTSPSQRTGNKQHYADNKEYTLACPSSDHTAIYSQAKTATTEKGLLLSQPNIDVGLQLSHTFNASLPLCTQANDRPIFISYGKTVFCIAFIRPEQWTQYPALPVTQASIVSPFNFFPVSSLQPFLLSLTSGVSALALCWKITSFQSHSG